MPTPISRSNAAHYLWGEVSHGWRLVDDLGLSVIEEEVPAGAGEEWHIHRVAQQFFYVLEGAAVMCLEAEEIPLATGEGLTVAPGQSHRFTNRSESPVRFIVISSPNTRGDRYPIAR
ncbi:MAG TPA: cupin domain-containing protein [Microbacterium sp.]|uniref:cupin domain-containing protein n=1 Tax=Microbacterium sp. TaxID=51671 RepID=UPI002F927081